MKNNKKLISLAIAIVMVLSLMVVTVSASNSWKFSGYDTSYETTFNDGPYGKMWYEVNSKGVPTGNKKIEGYAAVADWKIDFYEAAFPHEGVQRLWLDGISTSVTRYSGTTANWETKFQPLFWEVKYPYRIIEGLYSNVNGKWILQNEYLEKNITTDDVRQYLGKNAQVTSEYKQFGFADFEIIGDNKVVDAAKKYEKVLGYVPAFPKAALSEKALSEKDSKGNYVMSDTDIAERITLYNSEYLTGPDLAKGGTKTINSVSYWFNNDVNPLSWFNDDIIRKADRPAKISWTPAQSELEYPYAFYEILVVNGVILDGRTEGGVTLPHIYRYTGGTETPKVTYKFAFTEAAYPHNSYNEKFVDGKPTGILVLAENNVTYVYAFTEAAYPYNIFMEKIVDGKPTGKVFFLEERDNKFGVVDYKLPALDNKLQGSYGTTDTIAVGDEEYPGMVPGFIVIYDDVDQKIRATEDKSMR